MNILALDTASQTCSVSLHTDHGQFFRAEPATREHSRHILPMIEDVLAEAAIKPASLGLLAWNAGPGSFTGLRIGASVVQALSYSLAVPVLSLSSLELLAHSAARLVGGAAGNLAVAVDARMNGVYWATFRLGENGNVWRTSDDQLLSLTGIQLPWADGCDEGNWQVAGDAWLVTSLADSGLQPVVSESSARDLIALAVSKELADWLNEPATVMPNYVGGLSHWKKRQPRGVA